MVASAWRFLVRDWHVLNVQLGTYKLRRRLAVDRTMAGGKGLVGEIMRGFCGWEMALISIIAP